MLINLYTPNFCSDCGVKLSLDNWNWKQKWLLKGYFCKNCAKRLKSVTIKSYFLISLFLFLLVLPVKYYFFSQPTNLSTSLPTNLANKTLATPVAVDNSKAIIKATNNPVFQLCGAKTLAGKKCQRRVKIPGYCWQHQASKPTSKQ